MNINVSERRRSISRRSVRYLPCDKRRKSGKVCNKKLIGCRCVSEIKRVFAAFGKYFLRYVKRVDLALLFWRIFVFKSAQHLAFVRRRKAYRVNYRQYTAVLVEKNNVAVRSHYLADKIPLRSKTHIVRRAYLHFKCSVKSYLFYRQYMSARKMFSQQHTEHRRRRRVLPFGIAKTCTRVSCARGQKQTLIPVLHAQSQHYLISVRLIYFIYSCSDDLYFKLFYDRRHYACIKRHCFIPPDLILRYFYSAVSGCLHTSTQPTASETLSSSLTESFTALWSFPAAG